MPAGHLDQNTDEPARLASPFRLRRILTASRVGPEKPYSNLAETDNRSWREGRGRLREKVRCEKVLIEEEHLAYIKFLDRV